MVLNPAAANPAPFIDVPFDDVFFFKNIFKSRTELSNQVVENLLLLVLVVIIWAVYDHLTGERTRKCDLVS